MKLLLIYWAFLLCGYFIGDRLRRGPGRNMKLLANLMMGTVYCLCFIMGLRMGVNEQVTSNLGSIGLMALTITFCCVCGSMLAILAARKILGMDRYGNLTRRARRKVPEPAPTAVESGALAAGPEPAADTPESAPTAPMAAESQQAPMAAEPGQAADGGPEKPEEGSGLNFTSTIILLSLVAAGMLIGAFVLARWGADFLTWFDGASNLALIIVLCALMFLVGMDMGHSVMVVTSLKTAGFRVLVFPVASMVGTMVFGIAACLAFGFTAREATAIPIGFGWYSYAPVVIASAGNQYMVASAVSFMHNVIREVSGIILIPVAAKKIGYLEAASIPGIAAMDVCVPIVARACRPDTVIYSFSIGLIMCVVTSVGVPLAMGV